MFKLEKVRIRRSSTLLMGNCLLCSALRDDTGISSEYKAKRDEFIVGVEF